MAVEDIETREQQALLLAAGCDYGQGYPFSRPISATELEKLLTTFQPQRRSPLRGG